MPAQQRPAGAGLPGHRGPWPRKGAAAKLADNARGALAGGQKPNHRQNPYPSARVDLINLDPRAIRDI